VAFFNLHQFIASLVYAALGIVIFIAAFKIAEKLLPFNLIKELTEDDNVAVGILMGAIILGLAIIIASAIHG
jgi:putative membrane protein